MDNNIYVIEGSPQDWEEAIYLTYRELQRQNCVKESFLDACIEREKHFPTGLPTKIPAAIPHTDTKHVLCSSACLLKLQNPVSFKSIEDASKDIDVYYVLNLAMKQAGNQVNMLSTVVEMFQNHEFAEIMKYGTLEDIRAAIVKKVEAADSQKEQQG